jgi:hypothetical protein
MPGGVEAFILEKGEKIAIQASDKIWQETHLSAILRAIHYDLYDDRVSSFAGVRKFDPIPNRKSEEIFLELAAAFFFKGPSLGGGPMISTPSISFNHLSDGIMKYFSNSCRNNQSPLFFEKMFEINREVGPILAKSYLESGIFSIKFQIKK